MLKDSPLPASFKEQTSLNTLDSLNWYDERSAPAGIPILDLHNLHPSEMQLEHLTKEISRNITCGSGFFYIKNFDIPETVFSEFLDVNSKFFQQPESVRKKMLSDDLPLRGYTALNSESAAQILGTGQTPDMCMKYTWTQDNIYPNQVFKEVWDHYASMSKKVAKYIISLLRQALGSLCDPLLEWQQLSNGEAMIRHMVYPDISEPFNSEPFDMLRMAAHKDIGLLTLLYQTPCPNGIVSLEAEINGTFVGIPAIRNTMVVNLGETLSHLTSGRSKAAKHRVIRSRKPGCERSSTALFYFPNGDFNLDDFSGSNFQGLHSYGNKESFSEFIKRLSKSYCNKNA